MLLAHRNNSLRTDMSLHSDTLSWFRANLCCVLSREATHTNFIVFGLTWLGLEPMIYLTQGEHANHYTTDAAEKLIHADADKNRRKVNTSHIPWVIICVCHNDMYANRYLKCEMPCLVKQNNWNNGCITGMRYVDSVLLGSVPATNTCKVKQKEWGL